jgi:hypothetical protein
MKANEALSNSVTVFLEAADTSLQPVSQIWILIPSTSGSYSDVSYSSTCTKRWHLQRQRFFSHKLEEAKHWMKLTLNKCISIPALCSFCLAEVLLHEYSLEERFFEKDAFGNEQITRKS